MTAQTYYCDVSCALCGFIGVKCEPLKNVVIIKTSSPKPFALLWQLSWNAVF